MNYRVLNRVIELGCEVERGNMNSGIESETGCRIADVQQQEPAVSVFPLETSQKSQCLQQDGSGEQSWKGHSMKRLSNMPVQRPAKMDPVSMTWVVTTRLPPLHSSAGAAGERSSLLVGLISCVRRNFIPSTGIARSDLYSPCLCMDASLRPGRPGGTHTMALQRRAQGCGQKITDTRTSNKKDNDNG